MKRFYQLLISAVAFGSLFSACSSNDIDIVVPDEKTPRKVILDMTVQTGLEDQIPTSRITQVSNDHRTEYVEAPDRQFEYVSTLRVIILHPNSDDATKENAKYAVEEMRLVNTNDAGTPISDNLRFSLLENEWKHIIIIGNEASIPSLPVLNKNESANSVSDFLNNYFGIGAVVSDDLFSRFENWVIALPGDDKDTGTTPNLFYVDEKSRIPLTESFDIKTKALPSNASSSSQEDNVQKVNLFVSRLAAKITYMFKINEQSTSPWIDGEVLGVRLRYLDDKMYVFANNVRYYPTKYMNIAGTNDPDVGNLNPSTRPRYVTGLSAPSPNTYRVYTSMFDKPVKIQHYDNDSIPVVGPFYFTESMAMKSGQHFEISVRVRKGDNEKWLDYKPMTSNVLSFIPTYNPDDVSTRGYFNAIARSSHTKVTISFGGSDFSINETVVPYIGVDLDPVFGTNTQTPQN
ncbi:MAG: hypothetical protein K2N08_03655 [Muribaculaceae bacterium]|nr:hypothetical protein [Muribaculaceae bacterium]